MRRVYAVKYAERDARRPEHFLGGDPHDVPMPMDYYVWAVVSERETWVVDTGFGTLDAELRQRRLLRTAGEALAIVGVDAPAVTDVILTHLHYDHAGGLDCFPNARFHVQEREMAFATGRHMTEPAQRHGFTAAHVASLVQLVHDERVVFHDGDDELAPDLSVHLLGGHTDGMQVVRVETDRGGLVLASDSSHYYENFETGRPFPIVFDVDAMVAGWSVLRELAASSDAIVPGHDPLVLDRYPVADPAMEGVAVRLDLGRR
ncbi:MAG TPA: N-acyl homoserine lactonase family protein [Acidimicrobiales bacterium]|nr:N-acyl homoserine lactonase family protein [Acidimicrobiales bacterium]